MKYIYKIEFVTIFIISMDWKKQLLECFKLPEINVFTPGIHIPPPPPPIGEGEDDNAGIIICITYRNELGQIHRAIETGPANVWYRKNGDIRSEIYGFKDMEHRPPIEYDGKIKCMPSRIHYYESGNVRRKTYKINGCYQRDDGPSYISYHVNGIVAKESYVMGDKCHRIPTDKITAGPAYALYNHDGTIRCKKFCIDATEMSEESYYQRISGNTKYKIDFLI